MERVSDISEVVPIGFYANIAERYMKLPRHTDKVSLIEDDSRKLCLIMGSVSIYFTKFIFDDHKTVIIDGVKYHVSDKYILEFLHSLVTNSNVKKKLIVRNKPKINSCTYAGPEYDYYTVNLVESQTPMIFTNKTIIDESNTIANPGDVLTYVGDNKSEFYPMVPGGGSGNVLSVSGKIGVVTLTNADVGLSNVDNTSDQNKPLSNATISALSNKLDASVIGVSVASLDGSGNSDMRDNTFNISGPVASVVRILSSAGSVLSGNATIVDTAAGVNASYSYTLSTETRDVMFSNNHWRGTYTIEAVSIGPDASVVQQFNTVWSN
jgi:hypothetical protein